MYSLNQPAKMTTPSRKILLLLSCFLIVNLLDFACTYLLLNQAGDSFYEANPIADTILHHASWIGLLAYKLTISLIVMILFYIVFKKNPLVARNLCILSTAFVLLIVIYSAMLLGGFFEDAIEAEAIARERQLQQQCRLMGQELDHYSQLLNELVQQLQAEQITLTDAVQHVQLAIQQYRYYNPIKYSSLDAFLLERTPENLIATILLRRLSSIHSSRQYQIIYYHPQLIAAYSSLKNHK